MDERRLLAFDLDRTLLTEDYRLPLRIEQAIREARRSGHLVTVLTGRPLAAAQPYLEQLEIAGPYSVNHGAMVYGLDGEIIRHTRLPSTTVSEVLRDYLDSDEVDFSCVVGDVLYVRDPEDERWSWAHTRSRTVRLYDPAAARDADKIVFAADPRTERIEQEILARLPGLVTYLWGDGYLEITGPDADKGGALRLIAQLLQVPRESTVAFGDGLNDVTMIAWAGHGVAVGSYAHSDVIASAVERIAAPEEGGVASWIERSLLQAAGQAEFGERPGESGSGRREAARESTAES